MLSFPQEGKQDELLRVTRAVDILLGEWSVLLYGEESLRVTEDIGILPHHSVG